MTFQAIKVRLLRRVAEVRLFRRVVRTFNFYAENETVEQRNEKYRSKGVTIGRGVVIYASVLDNEYQHLLTIGDDCTITNATLLCHDDALVLFQRRTRAARTTIGDRVFIGYGSIVLPGVTIGSDVIVGAGSVVTKNVSDRTVVAGNPARVICSLDDWLAHRADDATVIRAVEISSNVIDPSVMARLREATASD